MATKIDLAERISERLPWLVLTVVGVACLLLLLAFRSPLLPVKAALMNLVSVCAAYGVVTAVFQWGWGASLLGLDGPVPIDSYMPMVRRRRRNGNACRAWPSDTGETFAGYAIAILVGH